MPVRPVAAQDPPFEHIQMSTIVVKPGMTSAFEAQVKMLNEARAKAKDPVARSFWQASRGGPARTFSPPTTVRYRSTLGPSARYVTAPFFDKRSDIDGWPELKDVVGQVEADKIDVLARGALESGSRYVIRRRPELSYIPTP